LRRCDRCPGDRANRRVTFASPANGEPEIHEHRNRMPRLKKLPAALIFDMDGVMIDSNPFHLAKWVDLLTHHGIPFDPKTLPQQLFGQRNDSALRFFLGRISRTESRRLSEELEATFRSAFKPHARPLPGLRALIRQARRAGIPMAVASSAMVKNIEFIVDALKLRPYFDCLVSGDHVAHPKPHPEIYLKAARMLKLPPEDCVAFEDSFVGIEAAKNAGMKCVGIGSTFPLADLRRGTRADLVVKGFEQLTLTRVRRLFEGPRVAPRRSTGRRSA
jgi:beta-phosphoglucomutase